MAEIKYSGTGIKENDTEIGNIYNKIISEKEARQQPATPPADVAEAENLADKASSVEKQTDVAETEDEVVSQEKVNPESSIDEVEDSETDNEQELKFDDWFVADSKESATAAAEVKPAVEPVKQDVVKQEQAANDYTALPPKLQKAIEMASKGEDFEVLFSNPDGLIDHRLFDDDTLLRNQNAQLFTNQDGTVDNAGLEEYLESLSEVQKRVEARKLRQQLDMYKDTVIRQKTQDEAQKRLKADMELRNAVNSMNQYQGFKVNNDQKAEIYKDIVSGKAAKELFFKDDNKDEYDMTKMAELYFLKKNFPKIKQFLIARIKNDTKKEEFEKISNVQIKGKEIKTDVSNADKSKLKGIDLWLEELKQKQEITKTFK